MILLRRDEGMMMIGVKIDVLRSYVVGRNSMIMMLREGAEIRTGDREGMNQKTGEGMWDGHIR
jgi:hypothetical protein